MLSAIFCAKPWPAAILLIIVSVLGVIELSRLFPSNKPSNWARAMFALVAGALSVSMAVRDDVWGLSGLSFALGIIASVGFAKNKTSWQFGLASFWLFVPIASLYRLWAMSQPDSPGWWNWQSLTLLVLFPLWAGDSAGIFVGKCCGKRLLAPSISPKKTWEGAIANALACLLLAWAVGWLLSISLGASLACGAICAVFGQVGDLFESHLKRLAEAKDSGTLLPGHGGILDRIDSVLFSAPLVVMALGFWR